MRAMSPIYLCLPTAALLAAACARTPPPAQPGRPASEDVAPANDAGSVPVRPIEAAPAAASTPPARTSHYAALDACPVIEDTAEEAGYRVQECRTPGGFTLRLVTADARDNLMLRAPGGEFIGMGLPGLVNGAFASVRPRVEWRGPAGEPFEPDVLIARYAAALDPDDPTRETAHLVVMRLSAPGPCVVALVPPSPTQSDQARRIADGPLQCR